MKLPGSARPMMVRRLVSSGSSPGSPLVPMLILVLLPHLGTAELRTNEGSKQETRGMYRT